MFKGYPETMSEIDVIKAIRLELKRYKMAVHQGNKTAQNYVRDVSILLGMIDDLGNPEYQDDDDENS